MTEKCYHCGKECDEEIFVIEDKNFCCNGCKTVYEILNEHQLSNFYELNKTPGIEPDTKAYKQFEMLDTPEVFEKVVEFSDGGYTSVTFFIPVIHCSSCIWLLESLPKINDKFVQCQVNFTKKSISLTYKSDAYKLSEVAKFLTSLGYKPIISLETAERKKGIAVNRRLMLQLAVAFFCAGNIMILAFPDYVGADSKWLTGNFKTFFRWLMLILSLPVVFFSAQDYFKSAFKGIEHDNFNMDVPISIGILVLFGRSVYEVLADVGYGYFDSLGGFVFFLLIGKYFQQSTYNFLSFDRDYKSFYPIAVTKIVDNQEVNIVLSELKKGDRLLIRNEEIVPADAILINGEAHIDNSFVTGESRLIEKKSGDKIFAGGKQVGESVEIEIIKPLDQSYLTKLWNNEVFKKEDRYKALTDRISKIFTVRLLIIALLTGIGWWFYDKSRTFEVVTSVLIVACPCALSLSAPFAMGNMMRILSKRGFYVKDTSTIENIAQVDTIVFDKTGTITENEEALISYEGKPLSETQKNIIKSIVRHSNHPLSRILYQELKDFDSVEIMQFQEIAGKGISAVYEGQKWSVGSASFVGVQDDFNANLTKVYIAENDTYWGCYTIQNKYRENLEQIVNQLQTDGYQLCVLSGDNDAERENLAELMPNGTPLYFNQKPQDKLDFVKKLQEEGKKVMMIGDGLNDAGALKQSNVGISIADNINSFSPSCDGILDGKSFQKLDSFLKLSKRAELVVKMSFGISFLYNIVGLTFAILGYFTPLFAAILMPLSSISVVIFATSATYIAGKMSDN